MSLASASLPDDPDALRVFAANLQTELARKEIEITARDTEIHAKTLHIEKLKMQLAVLRRARFGRSSEKLDRDIEQLELRRTRGRDGRERRQGRRRCRAQQRWDQSCSVTRASSADPSSAPIPSAA
jgi:hypothetical protein